jgi:hypothetical protein
MYTNKPTSSELIEMMRSLTIAAATLAMAAMPATAAEPPKPTPAQLKNAQDTLSLIVSALNSKEVPQETKNGLFGCLYENPLGKIAAGSAEVLAHDKKLDPKDPTQRLVVLTHVCDAPVPAPAKAK